MGEYLLNVIEPTGGQPPEGELEKIMRDDAADRGAAVPGRLMLDVERVFREEHGRAVAVLVRVFGDIDVAEDAVQDAFAAAVARWPEDGLPPSPAGWIITTAR